MLGKIASNLRKPVYIIGVILLLIFVTRVININYNSPSNDEALYIWMGQNMLYKGHWALYNIASWVGGHPYFYPTVTAIAYSIGGISASRILNIIFSLFCVYFAGKLGFEISYILTKQKKVSSFASIVAVVLLGFSQVVIYTSRLATYDMPSFMFFTASLYFLLKSLKKGLKTDEISKTFMLSSVFVTLSFAFKYIAAIFIPVVLAVSYLYIKSFAKKNLLTLWLTYFVTPLIVLISLVTLTQISYLLTYINSQLTRPVSSLGELGEVFILETWTGLIFWATGAVLLIIKKKWKFVLIGTIFITVVMAFHFLTLRLAAWDKHIFFIVYIFSVTAGVGLAGILKRKIWGKLLVFLLVIYTVYNLVDATKFNSIWPDFRLASKYISQNIQKSDTLLAEESSSVLLPISVTTFDWFTYKGLVGTPAYRLALDDGYFKYVELSPGYPLQTKEYQNLENEVLNKIRGSYSQIYKDKYFIVYKQIF